MGCPMALSHICCSVPPPKRAQPPPRTPKAASPPNTLHPLYSRFIAGGGLCSFGAGGAAAMGGEGAQTPPAPGGPIPGSCAGSRGGTRVPWGGGGRGRGSRRVPARPSMARLTAHGSRQTKRRQRAGGSRGARAKLRGPGGAGGAGARCQLTGAQREGGRVALGADGTRGHLGEADVSPLWGQERGVSAGRGGAGDSGDSGVTPHVPPVPPSCSCPGSSSSPSAPSGSSGISDTVSDFRSSSRSSMPPAKETFCPPVGDSAVTPGVPSVR